MDLVSAAFSDVGGKHRANEDRYLCSTELRLFAVADGMGGNAGAAFASAKAIEALAAYYRMTATESPRPSVAIMQEAMLAANFVIYRESLRRAQFIGMGTTLTAATVDGHRITVGHVGDSRGYLARGGKISRITLDHATDRRLERCVGFGETVAIETLIVDAAPGDTLVLCSDGVHDVVADTELLRLVERTPTEALAKEVVRLAQRRGASDDTTVVAVRLAGPQPPAAS